MNPYRRKELIFSLVLFFPLCLIGYFIFRSGWSYVEKIYIQSQLKPIASAYASTQKAFFAEYKTYSNDIQKLGFSQEGHVFYTCGFVNQPDELSFPSNSKDSISIRSLKSLCPDCTFSEQSYKLLCAGKFSGELDVWSMDQDQNFVHIE